MTFRNHADVCDKRISRREYEETMSSAQLRQNSWEGQKEETL